MLYPLHLEREFFGILNRHRTMPYFCLRVPAETSFFYIFSHCIGFKRDVFGFWPQRMSKQAFQPRPHFGCTTQQTADKVYVDHRTVSVRYPQPVGECKFDKAVSGGLTLWPLHIAHGTYPRYVPSW